MTQNDPRQPEASAPPGAQPADGRRVWLWLALACVIVLVFAILLPRQRAGSQANTGASNSSQWQATSAGRRASNFSVRPATGQGRPRTAQEIVASQLSRFGRSRREIARAIGRRAKKPVPREVEEFFDAIERGDWDDIHTRWQALSKRSGQYDGSTHAPELDDSWPAVLEAYGAAEAAHLWPPQKLLDYGSDVLGSLRPGMVYVGGTDPGRFIPTFLNESSAEQHIVLTQNALADGRYMDYLRFLYGERFSLPTEDDSRRAFQDYLADAQKRLQHDPQFPAEPKQVLPGEDIKTSDGKIQVSGQVAVMGINERLLQSIMQKNPEATFGLEESFPLRNTYAAAAPLGPLMELRADSAQNPLNAESATQVVGYWRTASQRLLSDPEAKDDSEARKEYGHMAQAQANLLASHDFNDQAEQAYSIATQLSPSNLEPVRGLAALLAREGRAPEGRQLLDNFARNFPEHRADAQAARGAIILSDAPPGK